MSTAPSAADARVTARAVRPEDREAWDMLFQAYREFYKLPHDAAVRIHVAKVLSDLMVICCHQRV